MQKAVGANGVTHLIASRNGWLAELLAPEFPGLHDLLDIGAVYHNKIRTRENAWVTQGDYLRVHPKPLRYGAPGDPRDWVLEAHPDFLILNKPAGLPVHATIDNALENLHAVLTPYFPELHITQRLDAGTSGLMLLARNKRFQAEFNKHLLHRRVGKHYVGLAEHAPPSGLWLHYIEGGYGIPKALSLEPGPGRRECRAQVGSVRARGPFWETPLEALTGRTHQLRAQMAFHRAPLLGDVAYGGTERDGFHSLRLGLHCERLSFPTTQGERRWNCPAPW